MWQPKASLRSHCKEKSDTYFDSENVETWASHDGGRVKVDFFNVDKRFWRVDLGQNWAMSSMSTRFE